MKRDEAEALTGAIRMNNEEYAYLIYKAWDEKAWLALDFTSFGAWLRDAVGISRARGYQLVSLVLMEERLEDEIWLPTDFTLSDRACRVITAYGYQDFMDRFDGFETLGTDRDAADNLRLFYAAVNEVEKAAKKARQPDPQADDGKATYASLEVLSRNVEALPDPAKLDDLATLIKVEAVLTSLAGDLRTHAANLATVNA